MKKTLITLALTAAKSAFGLAREHGKLLALEAKELKKQSIRKVVFAAAGGFFVLICYFFALVGLTGWLAWRFEHPWYFIAFYIAAFHLLVGLILLLLSRKKSKPFNMSKKEMAKNKKSLAAK